MKWILSLTALAGAILNAQALRISFAIWILTNLGWIAVNVRRRSWSEVFLWLGFLATSIHGWLSWSGM
jgi:hypothetical protein